MFSLFSTFIPILPCYLSPFPFSPSQSLSLHSPGSAEASAAWRVSHYRWYFSSNATASRWVLTDDSFKLGEHLSRCAFNERKEAATAKVKVMPSPAFSYSLWSAKKNAYVKYEATSHSG